MARSALIIEDEPLLGRNLQKYLRCRGWSALLARSGREAFELYALSRPRVVLTDYQLPDMTGLDVLVTLRAQYGAFACILMTADTGAHISRLAAEHRVCDLLYKPFALSTMERSLQESSDKGAGSPCRL